MYKVFFNGRQIILTQSLPENRKNSSILCHQLEHLDSLPEIIQIFLTEEEDEVWVVFGNLDKLWQKFRENFILIDAAGGVVRKDGKFLFIFRRAKWDLPKGKIENGESARQAALREVEEECGVFSLSIQKQLPTTWHIYQSPYRKNFGEWVLKETSWFEMNLLADEEPIPQTEEDISEIKWVANSDFAEILGNTYPNLEQIIRLYL
jgi:8-oxo-dGTP pyrophosphatase MutT (NUDIX family)